MANAKVLNTTGTQIRTGECRLSYCNLIDPKKFKETDKEAKFSCTLLIPKDTEEGKGTYQMLMSAVTEAAKLGAQKHFGGRVPTNPNHTVKDGDTDVDDLGELKSKKDPSIAGHWVLRLSSKYRPVLKVLDGTNIIDLKNPEDVYSGMRGVVSCTAFAYSGEGRRGISFVLNNVCKTRDDEPLVNRLMGDEFGE